MQELRRFGYGTAWTTQTKDQAGTFDLRASSRAFRPLWEHVLNRPVADRCLLVRSLSHPFAMSRRRHPPEFDCP